MSNNFIKPLVILICSLTSINVFALSNIEIESHIEGASTLYEDKVDISYLKKVVVYPENDWIGKKVFEKNGVCFEVNKDLKIKKVEEPFGDLYSSAKLPDEIEIGLMKYELNIVNCENYRASVKVIQ